MFSSWKEHKDNICVCCGEHTEDTVRVSDDNGFCRSTSTYYICNKHHEYFDINNQTFVKVEGNLFQEFNADYGILGCWETVRSLSHYEYLKNKNESDFMSDVKFKGWSYHD